ncbi:sulfotransferase family protein [Desulfospira joergensenii]|uniref:sulfotransferase family protein n=1 Tax=Desulfospira joergensenii TaxID=53329 RepID=UPI0003B47F86|nr:sulfotransferase [Desulfospira joergensenii]
MVKKVVIIGAPRSGTNIIRDVITSFDNVGTWPCDEINLIWRYGNSTFLSDEFTPDMVRDKVKAYIREAFSEIRKQYQLNTVVEKTCANSLRLSFVNEILPDAKYILIYRNGFDAVASAKKRWIADFDLKYTMKKVRFTPIRDLPYYGIKFLRNRTQRIFSSEKRLKTWGPVTEEIQKNGSRYSLNQVCAFQWKRCIQNSFRDLPFIPEKRMFQISYESFVRNPFENIKKICDFLSIPANTDELKFAVRNVNSKSIGKYRKELSNYDIKEIIQIIEPELKLLKYESVVKI